MVVPWSKYHRVFRWLPRCRDRRRVEQSRASEGRLHRIHAKSLTITIRYVITMETDTHRLGYSITIVADSLAPGHQRTPCWLEYGCMAWHRYVVSTAIRQPMFERSGKFGNPLFSLLLTTMPSDDDKAQCDDDDLPMKTRFRNKIGSFIKASLQ